MSTSFRPQDTSIHLWIRILWSAYTIVMVSDAGEFIPLEMGAACSILQLLHGLHHMHLIHFKHLRPADPVKQLRCQKVTANVKLYYTVQDLSKLPAAEQPSHPPQHESVLVLCLGLPADEIAGFCL